MFFVILTGHKGSGKSFFAGKIIEKLENENYRVKYIDEHSIISESLREGMFYPEEVTSKRQEMYWSANIIEYDIVLIECSFIYNIIYQLSQLQSEVLEAYIDRELDLFALEYNILQVYVFFRDYERPETQVFLNMSHYLLETCGVDSTTIGNGLDERTEENLKKIMERIQWEL